MVEKRDHSFKQIYTINYILFKNLPDFCKDDLVRIDKYNINVVSKFRTNTYSGKSSFSPLVSKIKKVIISNFNHKERKAVFSNLCTNFIKKMEAVFVVDDVTDLRYKVLDFIDDEMFDKKNSYKHLNKRSLALYNVFLSDLRQKILLGIGFYEKMFSLVENEHSDLLIDPDHPNSLLLFDPDQSKSELAKLADINDPEYSIYNDPNFTILRIYTRKSRSLSDLESYHYPTEEIDTPAGNTLPAAVAGITVQMLLDGGILDGSGSKFTSLKKAIMENRGNSVKKFLLDPKNKNLSDVLKHQQVKNDHIDSLANFLFDSLSILQSLERAEDVFTSRIEGKKILPASDKT